MPEDLKILWRLSLQVLKRRGMQESRSASVSSSLSQAAISAASAQMLSSTSGPKLQGMSPSYKEWRVKRISVSIVTSLQCTETGTTLSAVKAENTSAEKKLFIFLPRKCSSLMPIHSHSVELLIVKTSKPKL